MVLDYEPDWWDCGDLLFADFEFGAHPAIVVKISDEALYVSCCTSRPYPEFGDDNFIRVVEGEGNLHHTSFAHCHEIHRLPFDNLSSDEEAFYIGAIEDETLESIKFRMKLNNVL